MSNTTRYPGLLAAGPLRIGGLCVPLPLVQGGMGVGVSLAELASAVANQGGIGVISAAIISRTPRYAGRGLSDAEALKLEIRRARGMTKGVIGVNIMMALSDNEALARAAAEEGADILFVGAGLPLTLPGCIPEGSKTKLAPIVSSGRAAALLIKWWKDKYGRLPDAFVVEGPLAGGHLGFKLEEIFEPRMRLEYLTQATLQETKKVKDGGGPDIPVIAAGGIFTGADIRAFLELGAAAVQMATRFVATRECDAPEAFKQAYVACAKDDIIIVKSPVGMPGRALSNAFMARVGLGQASPVRCRYHCISSCARDKSPYCIADALLCSLSGGTQDGLVFAGANAWRVDKMTTVPELIGELDREYTESLDGARDTRLPERIATL
jgi:nitronate monooxygenase